MAPFILSFHLWSVLRAIPVTGSKKDTSKMFSGLTLVLGGAASGKSAYAERLAEQTAPQRLYLATAQAHDAEMRLKIAAHRDRRGVGWQTAECPFYIGASLRAANGVVLLDCVTMWLSNHLLADHDIDIETDRLLADLADCPAPVIAVSNELGLSIVPENALARRFREAQGALNQRLAEQAGRVIFVAAGLPLALKGALP